LEQLEEPRAKGSEVGWEKQLIKTSQRETPWGAKEELKGKAAKEKSTPSKERSPGAAGGHGGVE